MNIIEDVIFPVLEEYKEEEDLDFNLSNDLVLYGDNSVFNSLGLVSFIIHIQDKVLELTGKDIVLVSADTMSKENSPFRTVQTLSECIEELLNNE